MYWIPIFHIYSRIRIHKVSKLNILILKQYFIGYLLDTPQIHHGTYKILPIYVSYKKNEG